MSIYVKLSLSDFGLGYFFVGTGCKHARAVWLAYLSVRVTDSAL